MTLSELLLELHRRLSNADIPHSFGGAIALAYYINEPRGTRDLDCNMLVPTSQAKRVFNALSDLIAVGPSDVETVEHDGQIRLFARDTPVDLFFNTHRYHDGIGARSRAVPFADTEIPILSGFDLVVFKCLFDNRKDWTDIYQIAVDGSVDLFEVRGALVELIGPADRRVAEFDEVVREAQALR